MKIKKHTVRYRPKIKALQLIALTISMTALLYLEISIPSIIESFNNDFNFNITVFHVPRYIILCEILIVIGSWFFFYYKSKWSFSKIESTKAKLFHILKSNKYYKTENDDSKSVYSSLKFKFYYLKSKLVVEAYSNGDPYTKKSNDMSEQLESALAMPLIEKNKAHPEFTRYEFRTNPIERLQFQKQSDITKSNGIIPLDSEKVWNFSKTPHAIIAGVTSGGKSFQLFILILQLAKQGADFRIADPKRSELSTLKHYLPDGDKKVVFEVNQILKIMREFEEKMLYRYEKYFSKVNSKMGEDYRHYNLRPCFLIIDEIASLKAMMDKKMLSEFNGYLQKIVMMGRAAGCYLIIATQKPEAEAVPTAIRDQFGLRIALGQMSNDGRKMALGNFEDLPTADIGTGKGYVYIDGLGWSNPHEYVSAYLDMDSINYRETLRQFVLEARDCYIDD
ncbi:FtsK/SpoIIIE domain-containing protein [Bacillus mycoides]|uniref:FtsK/SpoIIIE domain-containing protein n=1 Tax=Bacillus mycoides TaxID=1405 RepID=UPI001C01C2F0|nr:FtsK/SpoIIIE domain-containing protein [Bacillus mycoides]QWH04603.1 hypothetical protein EXW49_01570 [Bacillus mycoides]